MSLPVGKLRKRANSECLDGTIKMMGGLSGRISLDRLERDKSRPNAPQYRVYFITVDGEAVAVGAGWRKDIQRGDNAGQQLLSILIDYPGAASQIWVTAFPADDDLDGFNVVWSRKKDGASRGRFHMPASASAHGSGYTPPSENPADFGG